MGNHNSDVLFACSHQTVRLFGWGRGAYHIGDFSHAQESLQLHWEGRYARSSGPSTNLIEDNNIWLCLEASGDSRTKIQSCSCKKLNLIHVCFV